jgi:hypothetical protein
MGDRAEDVFSCGFADPRESSQNCQQREAVRMGQSVAQAALLEAGPCLLLNHLEVLAHVDEDVYNEARHLWETNGAVHGRDGTLPLGPL